ncbi:hypothetical protein BH24CHL8_BH24CHL8_04410 [soil metagenome]
MEDREARATDFYLDGLLARRGTGPGALSVVADLPLAIRGVADLLDRSLPRFHPSFRFEERLADQLRAAAAGRATPAHAGVVVAFPDIVPPDDALRESGERRARSLLVGGAIASGVSLAGAALLARRWGKGPGVAGVSGEGAV